MSTTDAVVPERLAGRYLVERLVGRGGDASVYRARDELLNRVVAIKLFPAGAISPEEQRRRLSEVHTLAGLNHPGLVTIYDAGEQDGRSYLVMQFVDGDTLAGRLRAGTLALPHTLAIGSALADALDYVHSHDVVHRDLKPANILLDADERPHLTDFGIARMVDATQMTATGFIVGTASYLSPEQVRGQAVGPPTDIYALGLVLLETLTGRREYPGNALESAVARLHRRPNLPASLPGPVAGLLDAMTADDPADRPTAAEIFAELRVIRPAFGDGARWERTAALSGPLPAGAGVLAAGPGAALAGAASGRHPAAGSTGDFDRRSASTATIAPGRPVRAPARERPGRWLAVAVGVLVVFALGALLVVGLTRGSVPGTPAGQGPQLLPPPAASTAPRAPVSTSAARATNRSTVTSAAQPPAVSAATPTPSATTATPTPTQSLTTDTAETTFTTITVTGRSGGSNR